MCERWTFDKREKKMTKFYRAVKADPKAIIVRCFDRRFRGAHAEFIKEELSLSPEDFWPIKVAGGAGAISRQRQMPAEFETLTSHIDLSVSHSKICHIILINHQDCRRYDSIVDRKNSPQEPEKQDLYKAIRLLSRKYPSVEISAYYAKFADEDQTMIFFEPVKASSLQKIDQVDQQVDQQLVAV